MNVIDCATILACRTVSRRFIKLVCINFIVEQSPCMVGQLEDYRVPNNIENYRKIIVLFYF